MALVGKTMAKTRGKANPRKVNEILRKKLRGEKYLVVIDNFETVEEKREAEEFFKSLSGGRTRILITFREKLDIPQFEKIKKVD